MAPAAPSSTPARSWARIRRLVTGPCLALLLPLGAPTPAGAPRPHGAARGWAASALRPPESAPPAPSCIEEGDTKGSARGRASGDVDLPLSGEAYFRAERGPDGRPALQVRLDEPDLGRWQLTFTLPGLDTLPRPADLPVVTPDSAAALAGGAPRADSARSRSAAPRVAAGQLYLFDRSALAGRTLDPVSGSISLDAVDGRGICGRFDVTWTGSDGGERRLRTRGTFRAVNAGFGEGDRRGRAHGGSRRDSTGASGS